MTLIRNFMSFAALTTLTSCHADAAPRYGVNHNLFRSPVAADAATFKILRENGISQLRVSVALTADTDAMAVPRLRQIVALARANNIRLMVMIQTGFSWGDRTDHKRYPSGDDAALYKQAYARTFDFVEQFRHESIDWEMGNEINMLMAPRLYGKGWSSKEFDTPVMRDWAYILLGMSDAIQSVNNAYGLSIRRVLNTTSTNFGFLDFMIERGVRFEVIDYHLYQKNGSNISKYWNGGQPSFNLIDKLKSYGRPIIFGEVNAGEIYDPAYNEETASKSLADSLDMLSHVDVEAVIVYELVDEPKKSPPENRFGLMYDLQHPKPALRIFREAIRISHKQ